MAMQQMLGLISGSSDYEINRSLRFNSGDTAYLKRTPSSAGNRKTWTWSGWVKLTKPSSTLRLLSAGTASTQISEIYYTSDKLRVFHYPGSSSCELITTRVFRDFSAWHHVVVAVDTTQSTTSNRARLYVNGSEVTSFSTATYPSQNTDTFVNGANAHYISAATGNSNAPQSNYYGDGYLADVHFIDGQALAASSFGEFDDDNNWMPKKYSGTYGTNGYLLKFDDNSSASALGTDSSGNTNTWTVNNLSVAAGAGNDSLIDTPTNYDASSGNNGGNYCTLNPLDSGTSNTTFSNGNLEVNFGVQMSCRSTFFVSSGKWYWEMTPGNSQYPNYFSIGIAKGAGDDQGMDIGGGGGPGNTEAYGFYGASSGKKFQNNSISNYGSTYTAGDVIGTALDLDNGTLTFYKNGSSLGTAFTGISGTWSPFIANQATALNINGSVNFGQRPFAYTPPTGYKSLCTTNLTDPTIEDGSTAMDVALYTGNGSTQSITSLNMSPDFVWIKDRSLTAGHALFDSVRGVQKRLRSDTTSVELTDTGYLTSFDSNGFSIGSHAAVNYNTSAYVGWAWDGGTTTATNDNGSIQSTVRANPSAGFSIVKYTGTGSAVSVGHGLNSAPQFVIVKGTDFADHWHVYHSDVYPKYLRLSTTDGEITNTNVFPSAPSNTVLNIGTDAGVNTNTKNFIAYCFAPVAGYSAFGSYTGNGSNDGPFLHTGFKPAFLIIKNTQSGVAEYWLMMDSARSPVNVVDEFLYPNGDGAEGTEYFETDFLSNGFKLRNTSRADNYNNESYVYMAFAEHPFKTARAR